MFRITRQLALILGFLTIQVAAAKVTISSVPGSRTPAVTFSGERYLVCWADPSGGSNGVYAHRVTTEMDVEEPEAIPVQPMTFCCSLDVASDGADFLVAWEAAVNAQMHNIRCCVVRGAGYAEDVQTVATGDNLKHAPSVAFASPFGGRHCYLVAWLDYRDGIPDVYVSRVSRDGEVIDQGGHLLVHGRDVRFGPCVTSDGDRFFVVWYEVAGGQPRLFGLTVGTDLSVGTQYPLGESSLAGAPDAVFAEFLNRYVVIWPTTSPPWGFVGRTCLPSGEPESDAYWIHSSYASSMFRPRCAASEINVMAVWTDAAPAPSPQIRCRRALARDAVGPVEDVSLDTDKKDWSSVASDGSYYLVVWADGQAPWTVICADTVSPYQRRLYACGTESKGPTGHNWNRGLALDPVSGWLHAVYIHEAPRLWPLDTVRYTYSTDGGDNWFPYENVGVGYDPCVVCENQGVNPVWVAYTSDWNWVECRARTAPHEWTTYRIQEGNSWPMDPSMSMCYRTGPVENPSVYLACANARSTGCIHFNRVDLLFGPVEYHQLETSLDPRSVLTPCVATTPGDIVHVVWVYHDFQPGNEVHRIRYLQRDQNRIWKYPIEDVSIVPGQPEAEPAWYPCIDAYGDSVFAVWRAGGDIQGSDGDAYTRGRDAEYYPPQWTPLARNLSGTPGVPSRYVQNSTKFAAVWQEKVGSQWDIWGNVLGEVVEIVETPNPSRWPDVLTIPPDIGHANLLTVKTIWSELLDVQGGYEYYEVMFKSTDYPLSLDGEPDLPCYYNCAVGDSARSRFCLSRDGWAKWRGFSVDYGRENLCYGLRYLNPNFAYVLRAILYHTARDTWEQNLCMDGLPVGRFRYRPLQPETLWVTIPSALYQRDCRVNLDIERQAGDFAVVADLRVYQLYPYRQGMGGEGVEGTARLPDLSGLGLLDPKPALFRSSTRIPYSISVPQDVELDIFDVQGRMVRRLASGFHKAGEYAPRWHGTDESGRRLGCGTYFVQLRGTGITETKKVVLAK